ncbi:MAG: ABC transporter ATP-binding protein [Firmicutes bacterium]|nr:ABC transporter ATP-binding protein [Bacillota bacterium]
MIEIKSLTKRYDKENVLSKLNCNIKENCIYGLVGANGSGKSTLLRLINGILIPDRGIIEIDGENTLDNELIKQNMVFIPDDLFFYPSYTLMDMAKFYQALYHNFDMEYLKKLASNLKLDLNGKLNSFSKGMKRQCALILALSTKAKYMFFDETFDGIDPVIRNFFKKVIAKQMSQENTTIIMTSHNLRELEDICDNLGLLYDGGILFESDIDSLKTNMFKVQISLKEEFSENNFSELDVLSFKKIGSIATIIIKDETGTSKELLESMNPIILDFLPLTLEEVFIYEMEALGYEFEELL